MPRYRVKEIAEGRGLSLSRLARLADLERGTITPLWKGEDTNPRMSTLEAIAYVLEVPVVELLGDDFREKNKAALAGSSC